MEDAEVKFGEWIENGFRLYKENFATLVLASLIAVVLSAVTVGVLAGPMRIPDRRWGPCSGGLTIS